MHREHILPVPAVRVEIRFKELKYEEVVWPLQQDPLVDRLRTPQTRGSICIVIGTIGELWSKNQSGEVRDP